MVSSSFSFAGTPTIMFGVGKFADIGSIARTFGRRALIVTGAASLERTGRLASLHENLVAEKISFHSVSIIGEPTPAQIDAVADQLRSESIEVVIAVGGGSVIDAGKAISAMLKVRGSVVDYLEGVGRLRHPGDKVPFIAVPTTAGTGSEATKNAVISQRGVGGFKKSLRHDSFVPNIALIDPALALGTPHDITAACGMDALTQLIESYLSTQATPKSDALALSGLETIIATLPVSCIDLDRNIVARSQMAYAALMSGLALATAGLGVVHGIAGPLGGFFPIPHGVACGTLLAASMKATVDALREKSSVMDQSHLAKCARLGRMMSRDQNLDQETHCNVFLDTLATWTKELGLPRLGCFGVMLDDVSRIAAAADNKNNPKPLPIGTLEQILISRL